MAHTTYVSREGHVLRQGECTVNARHGGDHQERERFRPTYLGARRPIIEPERILLEPAAELWTASARCGDGPDVDERSPLVAAIRAPTSRAASEAGRLLPLVGAGRTPTRRRG